MSILDRTRLLTEEGEPSSLSSRAAMEVEEDDDTNWVNHVYRQLNGAPYFNRNTWWQRLDKYRSLVVFFSVALSLFGAGVVVSFSSCFYFAPASFGATCTLTGMLALAAGILILATGILGCVTIYFGKRSFLLVFLATLLLYAVLCGMLLIYIIYARYHGLHGLQVVWAKMVTAEPGVVCDIEHRLECSGFKKGQCCRGAALDETHDLGNTRTPAACYLEAANGTTFDIDTREEVEFPHTMCASLCSLENAKYDQTCEAVLTSLLRSRFYCIIILPLSCTAFFLFLSGITMARVQWRLRTDYRMLHRF
ncbi:hypothetical protein, conserved [Leishmania tarentolae]|uniref:Uncharacterized protein n=1 Tax=Leishmania tarentolae TaxID=5689 RepID=A0A640KPX1_LEITA|nr:hypothetical protein, conserved [Leishmania tarentolae]